MQYILSSICFIFLIKTNKKNITYELRNSDYHMMYRHPPIPIQCTLSTIQTSHLHLH